MMKITLLWGVYGLIWGSRCAVSAEREVYPGLNYEFAPLQPNSIRLQSFEPADSYYDITYKRLMPQWQRRSVPMDGGLGQDDVTEYLENSQFDADTDINELVKLYTLLQFARNHGYRYPQQTGRRAELIKNLEAKYAKLKEAASIDEVDFLDKYVLNPPPEEARMYPPEDGEFDWNEEESDDKIYTDTEDHIPSLNEQQRLHYENALYGNYAKTHPTHNVLHENIMKDGQNKPQNFRDNIIEVPNTNNINQPKQHHANVHADHENYVFKANEEFPNADLNHIPIVENPTEFGYGPSDPRFFQEDKHIDAVSDSKLEKAKQPEKTQNPALPKTNEENKAHKDVKNAEKQGGHRNKVGRDDVNVVALKQHDISNDTTGIYIIAVVAGISAAATVGLIAVGIGWYNLQKHMKNAEDTDYPSYGIVGPNKDHEKKHRDEAGDRKLAQSAQMYHYQHQKQQIIAMGRNPQGGHGSMSDTEEEEDEEGNYTVYECPGLASIEGPLEVKNPMFDDDQLGTPSNQTSSKTTNDTTTTGSK